MDLMETNELIIQQKIELAEMFGFESRNKYVISDENGNELAYAAEKSGGILGTLLRQFLGHWRRFEIHVYDTNKQLVLVAKHPFRFYFSRLEVFDTEENLIGALEKKFSILSKKFDYQDSKGNVLLTVKSPLWRPWTFPFYNHTGKEKARISKKWSGLLKEAMTDTDNFKLSFEPGTWKNHNKQVVLMAALFIDLLYFEKKASD